MLPPQTTEKLSRLLRHARFATTFYSNLPELEETPSTEALGKTYFAIPFLTRQDIRSQPTRFLARTGDLSASRRIATTGTTGEPVEIILSPDSLAAEASQFGAHVDTILKHREWRNRHIFHLVLHPGAQSRSIPSTVGTARSIKWNLIRAWQCDDERFAACLKVIDGAVVSLLPSVAELICGRLRQADKSAAARPALIVLAGEMIDPAVRVLIGEVFQCPVTSVYSMAEAGIVATECAPGLYRTDDTRVLVEIVKPDGSPTAHGEPGEIVVTPLDNFVMPLLRYRTGDCGAWVTATSGQTLTDRVFALHGGRSPKMLISNSGTSLNIVRFAKILAGLPIDQYSLGQLSDGSVVFTYAAKTTLDSQTASIVTSLLRGAIGPECRILCQRIEERHPGIRAPEPSHPGRGAGAIRAEPEGPGLPEIERWLAAQLSGMPDIEAAILIGSALEPKWTTRYSDVDLLILISGDPAEARWLSLYQSLRTSLPKLSINIDRATGLSRRAPLVACRLLLEGRVVLGELVAQRIEWPDASTLQSYAMFWAQNAQAEIWHRLAAIGEDTCDAIQNAWIASKYCLNALRLFYLQSGQPITRISEVVAAASADHSLAHPWREAFLSALNLSMEHTPPIHPHPESASAHLQAALSCVRHLAAIVEHSASH